MQISPCSFSVPTDVTLKLPDGTIEAHKMILAAVSPVFERMLYGDFKEGRSHEVALPNDSWHIMKSLIDFVYNGKCEICRLGDILQLYEVVNRYQINKYPFQHAIGEAVLAVLDQSNYRRLLPKYASVISKEANRRAAEKVIAYIDYDITVNFSKTRDIPEEVLLCLLEFDLANDDLEVFRFLVKWHNYQAHTLGKPLQLTSQIFRCINYYLMIPQVLATEVASCDLVDKELISKAYHRIHGTCHALGEHDGDNPYDPASFKFTRKPRLDLHIDWVAISGISIEYNLPNQITISGQYDESATYILKSPPLSNGVFSFNISSSYLYNESLSFAIACSHMPIVHQYCRDLEPSNLVTVHVYNNYLFVKYIVSKVVKSTYSISDQNGYCITIFRRPSISRRRSVYFNITYGIKGDNYNLDKPGVIDTD